MTPEKPLTEDTFEPKLPDVSTGYVGEAEEDENSFPPKIFKSLSKK